MKQKLLSMGTIDTVGVYRIKSIVHEHYGITSLRVRKIQTGIANTNYAIYTSSKIFLLKIYSVRRTSLQIEYELKTLMFLASRNFECPRVVKTKDKTLFFQEKGRTCVLFHYIPGTVLTRVTPSRMYAIGNQLGRLHTLFRREKSMNTKIRETWEPRDVKKHLLTSGRQKTREGEVSRFLMKKLNKINFPRQLPSGFTHQDVKPQNIIVDSRGIMHFLDFDNSYHGVFLYDCMTTVIWTCFQHGRVRQEFLEAFFNGYEQQRKLISREKEFIYGALAFRLIREVTVWKTIYGMRKGGTMINLFLSLLKSLENRKTFCKL